MSSPTACVIWPVRKGSIGNGNQLPDVMPNDQPAFESIESTLQFYSVVNDQADIDRFDQHFGQISKEDFAVKKFIS
jgi:hypothetical protein